MRRLLLVSGILALAYNTSAAAQTGSSVLNIEGVQAGVLNSASGGAISADVINSAGSAAFPKKRLGAIKYEEFEASFGFSMNQSFYELLDDSMKAGIVRFDAQVDSLDANREVRLEREFRDAYITEFGFPGVDASSKDPASLSIKIKADSIRATPTRKSFVSKAGRARTWVASNFRLEMEGLDASRVTKIEPFSIKRTIPAIGFGSVRNNGKLEISNLKITMSEIHAKTWQQWHEDFLIRGNNDDAQEKDGMLVLLGPDFKTELGRVNLGQCGIFRLAETRAANGALLPGFVTAELYCEQMSLNLSLKR